MRVHITNIHGIGGTAKMAQQMVVDIAKEKFHYNEIGIFVYPVDSDSPEMLRTRLDGILASVSYGDIVICQFPTWNEIMFDEAFTNHLNVYAGLKKIIFSHDFMPLMFESNRYQLKRTIDLYNQADVLIVPSQNMANLLYSEGLKVQKVIVQRMWDCQVSIDTSVIPRFCKMINFAGDTNGFKFSFVQEWKYDKVKLAVTAREGDWEHNENIEFIGWFENQDVLANTLRRRGGFGLLWTENDYYREYMKLNACSKLSLYLAAGLPVIVHSSIAEVDTICQKNLGLVVDSLDEAVKIVDNMTEEQYDQMRQNVEKFGELIREGYFTKKILIDSVFKLLYE